MRLLEWLCDFVIKRVVYFGYFLNNSKIQYSEEKERSQIKQVGWPCVSDVFVSSVPSPSELDLVKGRRWFKERAAEPTDSNHG